MTQDEATARAEHLLAHAERAGWHVRPGLRPGVIVAERGETRCFGASPIDLAEHLASWKAVAR